MRTPRRAVTRLLGATLVAAAAMSLGACAFNALEDAPPDPSLPWNPGDRTGSITPAEDAAVTALQPTAGISREKTYGLAELIDLAQMHNPATRIAWQEARQSCVRAPP